MLCFSGPNLKQDSAIPELLTNKELLVKERIQRWISGAWSALEHAAVSGPKQTRKRTPAAVADARVGASLDRDPPALSLNRATEFSRCAETGTRRCNHGRDGMACKAGKGTDLFAAIPNRRNHARGPTKAQQPQPMTQRKRLTHARRLSCFVCGAHAVTAAVDRAIVSETRAA